MSSLFVGLLLDPELESPDVLPLTFGWTCGGLDISVIEGFTVQEKLLDLEVHEDISPRTSSDNFPHGTYHDTQDFMNSDKSSQEIQSLEIVSLKDSNRIILLYGANMCP